MPAASGSPPFRNGIAISSSSLASVAYDATRAILQVEFCDRSIYQYLHVPEKTHHDLMRAESKGAYFNRHIRDHFVFTKLRVVSP